MNRNQVTKRAYLAPKAEVIHVASEIPMLANSPVLGGHNDAVDDEELNAKQNSLFEDEEDTWTTSFKP